MRVIRLRDSSFQNGLILRIRSSSKGYGLALEANLRDILKRLIYTQ